MVVDWWVPGPSLPCTRVSWRGRTHASVAACAAVWLQVQCAVPVDEPIFQPFPPEVTFHTYEPFKTYEATIYFRNNDTVGTGRGRMDGRRRGLGAWTASRQGTQQGGGSESGAGDQERRHVGGGT